MNILQQEKEFKEKEQKKTFMILKLENNAMPFNVVYISVIGTQLPCIIFHPSKKLSCIYFQSEIDQIIPILKKKNIQFKVIRFS